MEGSGEGEAGGGFSRRGSRKRKSWGERGETRPEAVIDFERDDGGFPLEVARGLGRGAWLCMANGSVFSPFLFSGEKWVGWDRRVYLFFFFLLPFPFSFLFLPFVLLGFASRNFAGFFEVDFFKIRRVSGEERGNFSIPFVILFLLNLEE